MDRNLIILALTGASGVQYGLRLLECLLQGGKSVYLMISPAAQVVVATETDIKLPQQTQEISAFLSKRFNTNPDLLQVFGKDQWMAPVASGSHRAYAMVVCPCSSGSLAAIAGGSSDNLIERAADVMLKEQRKLILVPRETPLSLIHLENMTRLARMQAVILPANPGFYHRPQKIEELVDFIVARILDHLQIEHQLMARWGEDAGH